MKRFNGFSQVVLLVVCSALLAFGQATATQANNIVPRLVRFSGTLTDTNGKSLTSMAGVTFSLYKDSDGGSPLWIETQNVQPDSKGHYTVLLGSTKSEGVSSDLFASGEARWLGVQAQGQAEQSRALMVSVPYALKAVDAETLGGKPASAFQLALPQALSGTSSASENNPVSKTSIGDSGGILPPCSAIVLCGTGTVNFIPEWTGLHNQGNSIMQENAAKTGIGILAPPGAYTLNIPGTAAHYPSVNIGTFAAYPGTLNIWGSTNSGVGQIVGITQAGSGTAELIQLGSGLSSGTGVEITNGIYGVVATGSKIPIQGISGGTASPQEGVLGISSTDVAGCPVLDASNDACAGVVGVEKGTNNDTIGVYGYTASSVGAGMYGRNVSPSSVAGIPPDPSAGVWGDSSQQTGVQGTSDVSSAFYGENNTGGSTYATGWFVNDSTTPGDLVVEADGGTGSSCTIDINGNLSCFAGSPGGGGVSAAYLSTGGGNTDMAGICTIGGGGVCTEAFVATYTNPPVCVVTDPAGSVVTYVVATTSLTINGTVGHQANYICVSLDSLPPGKKGHGRRREHHNPAVHAGSPGHK
jgi:hypothetical protein